MTSPWKQLKTAADKLTSTADLLEKAAAVLDKNTTQTSKQKTAAAQGQQKTAAEQARIGQLAKVAASKLREAGLISSQEQADVFANGLLNHEQALAKIAQLTEHVTAPKIGSVVVDDTVTTPESADDVYEKRAAAALQRLHLT